jgi:hypothetical protein
MSNGFGNTHTLPPPDIGKFVKATVSGYELAYPSDANGKTLDDKVDKDSIVMAAVRLVQSKLLTADAQPAFRIMGDGKIEWGAGGSSAPAVSLYRYGNESLGASAGLAVRHDWGIWTEGSTPAASNMISHYAPGSDNQPRIRIKGDGQLEWGPGGSAVTDTKLYRQTAGILHTNSAFTSDVSFYVNAPNTIDAVFATWTAGGSNTRFLIGADGKTWWGNGIADPDVNLYRDAADWLATDDSLWVKGTIYSSGAIEGNPLLGSRISGTQVALGIYVTGAAQDSFHSLADGTLQWGPGNAAVDTDLFRSGAASLYTNSQFAASGQIISKAGTALQIALAYDGKLYFGNALDTNLYRSVANFLKTDDNFVIASPNNLYIEGTGTQGIIIGTDTNLYRSTANTLKTDDALIVVGPAVVGSYLSIRNDAGRLYFGSADDVSLARYAAGIIKSMGYSFIVEGILETNGVGPGAPYSGVNVNFPGIGQRWVSYGDADSAGSGWRQLRVLN